MINQAVALIAEFDQAAATVFASRPFSRPALAKAFRAGFRTHSQYSTLVCDLIENIAQLDALDRAVTA